MTKPNVSREEMLEKLDLLKQAADAWVEEVMSHTGGMEYQKELDDAEKVLRALILAVGEWKKKAMKILGEYYIEDVEIKEFLREIRDFGEGE